MRYYTDVIITKIIFNFLIIFTVKVFVNLMIFVISVSHFFYLIIISFELMTDQQPPQLRKPTCTFYLYLVIKVIDIKPGNHGFNVYVKVVKVEITKVPAAEGKERTIVKAVVGDSTSLANATFTDPPADHLKEGQVLAIRNGRSNVQR